MAGHSNLKNSFHCVPVKTNYTSEESYIKCVEYGTAKAHYPSIILFGKAILAGFFVGLCAHASGIAGGLFYFHKLREYVGTSMGLFVYSFTFPIAFLCIVSTGTDLFTGNTLAVTIALLQKKINFVKYLRVMSLSLTGNYIGAIICAFLVSYCSGAYNSHTEIEKNHIFEFLKYMAYKKVNHGFLQCMCLAIGCNIFVCLAVYFVLTIRDGSGLVFSVFFIVYSFAIAGFEHTIANIYTLNLALMYKTGITFIEAYFKNLLPTLIGNYIAGGLILAFPLFFFYSSCYVKYDSIKDDEIPITNIHNVAIELKQSDEKEESIK